MASLLEEIADRLARDVIRAAEVLGDDDLVGEMSKLIGASSPTTQEAFTTAVRVRLAEQRARRALEERLGPRYAEVVAASQPAPAPAPVRAEPEPAPVRIQPVPSPSAPPVRAEPSPVRPQRPVPRAESSGPAPLSDPSRGAGPTGVQRGPGLRDAPVAFEAAPTPPVEARAALREAFRRAPPPEAEPSVTAPAPSGVRPRMGATLDKPAVTPAETTTAPASPESLAAALALAASLPRRPAPPSEPKPAPTAYPDIEIPDGDWG